MIQKLKHIDNNDYPGLITRLSTDLIRSFPDNIIDQLEKSLGTVANSLNADRCYIYLFAEENRRIFLAHQYRKNGAKEKIPQHEQIDNEDFSALIQPILSGSSVYVSGESNRSAITGTVRAIMQVENTRTFIQTPMLGNTGIIGILGVDWGERGLPFSIEMEQFLITSGKLFATVIEKINVSNTDMALEKKYKSLFTNSEDIVFITTPEGKLVEINPAGVKLFGYNSAEEMMQLDIGRDLFINEKEREKYKRKIELNGNVKDYELNLKDKNGKRLYVIVSAHAVTNGKGEIIAYQGIMRNITYSRHLEQQLFQAKKMESIGLLAGGVAHDFNNILTTISGYAELTRMELDKSNPLFENMENILKGVKRAEDLIHQLLAFSRRQMIKPVVININQLIRELHSMLARLISEDIRFELNLKENLGCIKADPVQIQQILTNLIVNANHALRSKGENHSENFIRISTDAINIDKTFIEKHPGSREGKYILIALQDTGVGMDEETRKSIFEPFFSTKKDGEGTGLGLATVYGIVKQNEGNIYVESSPGGGSTFSVYWPATEEQIPDARLPESKVTFAPRTETILCVEDDYNVRKLMCSALQSLGYKIIEAENGRVALEKVKKDFLWDKIDLVISDIIMPELSGEDLAAELRKSKPEMKILLCSGFTDSRVSLHDSYKQKGYHFLAKPYSLNKLEKTIRRIIDEDIKSME
jgi:PAS domain S-box-containing protein